MKKFLANEPLRVRLYSVAALVLGYLVARGLLSPTDAEFAGSLAVLVLGVETSRALVTPNSKVYATKAQALGPQV